MPPVCWLQKETTGAYDFDMWSMLTSRAALSLLEQIRIWCSTFGALSDIGLMRPRRLLGFSSRNGLQVVPEQHAAQQDSFILSLLGGWSQDQRRRKGVILRWSTKTASPMWFPLVDELTEQQQLVAETSLSLLEFHAVFLTDRQRRNRSRPTCFLCDGSQSLKLLLMLISWRMLLFLVSYLPSWVPCLRSGPE